MAPVAARARRRGMRRAPLALVCLGIAAVACMRAPLHAAAAGCSASPSVDPSDKKVPKLLASARWRHAYGKGLEGSPPEVARMSPEEADGFSRALLGGGGEHMLRPHAGPPPPPLSELVQKKSARVAVSRLFARHSFESSAGDEFTRMANAVQVADQLAFARANLTLHYRDARQHLYKHCIDHLVASIRALAANGKLDGVKLTINSNHISRSYPSLSRSEFFGLRHLSEFLHVEIQVVDVEQDGRVSALPSFDFGKDDLLPDVGIRRLYLLRYLGRDGNSRYEALVPRRSCVKPCSPELSPDFAYSHFIDTCKFKPTPTPLSFAYVRDYFDDIFSDEYLAPWPESEDGNDHEVAPDKQPQLQQHTVVTPQWGAAATPPPTPTRAAQAKTSAPRPRTTPLQRASNVNDPAVDTTLVDKLIQLWSSQTSALAGMAGIFLLSMVALVGAVLERRRTRAPARREPNASAGLDRQLKQAREKAETEAAAADKLRREAKGLQQKLQQERDAAKAAERVAREEVEALQQRLRQSPAGAAAAADAARRARESSEELVALRKQLASAEARAGAAERRAAEAEASACLGRAAAEDAAAESKPLATSLAAAEREKQHLRQQLAASQAEEESLRRELAAAASSGAGSISTRAAALETEVEDLRRQLAAVEEVARERAAAAAAAEQRATAAEQHAASAKTAMTQLQIAAAEQRAMAAEQRATDAEQRASQATAEAGQRQAGQAAALQRLAEAEREAREARAGLEQLRASAVRIDAQHLETLGAAELAVITGRLSEAMAVASKRVAALVAAPSQYECAVCSHEFPQEGTRLLHPCAHPLCAACAEKFVREKRRCPLCSRPVESCSRIFLNAVSS